MYCIYLHNNQHYKFMLKIYVSNIIVIIDIFPESTMNIYISSNKKMILKYNRYGNKCIMIHQLRTRLLLK